MRDGGRAVTHEVGGQRGPLASGAERGDGGGSEGRVSLVGGDPVRAPVRMVVSSGVVVTEVVTEVVAAAAALTAGRGRAPTEGRLCHMRPSPNLRLTMD